MNEPNPKYKAQKLIYMFIWISFHYNIIFFLISFGQNICGRTISSLQYTLDNADNAVKAESVSIYQIMGRTESEIQTPLKKNDDIRHK